MITDYLIFSMHINKVNILTASFFAAFIFFVFYGNLLEHPSRRSGHRIQTIHLDVRLSNLSPGVKNPKILTPNDKAPKDPSGIADKLADPSPVNEVSKDNTLDFENLELKNIIHDKKRLAILTPGRNAPAGISPLEILKTENNNTSHLERHFMIFLVPSTPNAWKLRHSMRKKWLNQSYWRKEEFQGIDPQHLDFKLMFIIGRHAWKDYSKGFLEEVSLNDDMYLLDIPESRKILKDKVLFGMKESIKRFDYDFLIKFDHDTMVDLPRMGSGISKFSRKNLFTGSCRFFIWSKKLYRKIHYCSGGAYILSRDVVQKIAALNETDTNVSLGRQEPEDAYTGYLVDVIRTDMNISELRPKHKRTIVNKYHHPRDHFWYWTWFVHFLKGWSSMDRGFNCRVTADLDACPPKRFFYPTENSTQCICDTETYPWWKN